MGYTDKVKFPGLNYYEVSYMPTGSHSTKVYSSKFFTKQGLTPTFIKSWFEENLNVTVGMVKEITAWIPEDKSFLPFEDRITSITVAIPDNVNQGNWLWNEKFPLPFPKRSWEVLSENLKQLFGSDLKIHDYHSRNY